MRKSLREQPDGEVVITPPLEAARGFDRDPLCQSRLNQHQACSDDFESKLPMPFRNSFRILDAQSSIMCMISLR
jgi:hypothetical protein